LRKGFRVVAFEADPELIGCCRERLKEFLENGQLTIVEGAIVDPDSMRAGERTVRFYKNSDVTVWGTVNADWAERNARLGTSSNGIEVDAINFTDAIREHGVPYFMKIDVEGCDTVCIGALSGFAERPAYISIESDKTSFANIEHEIDLFSKLGYTSFQAVEQSKIKDTPVSGASASTEGRYICSPTFRGRIFGTVWIRT
jgi:FkbM family methyltransferase